jgi:hypothetical protein
MRTTSLLLIFALIFIHTLAVKIDFASFVEFSDLKGDSYAESLVQTINTALEQKGGRIENIQDLLTELYNKLVADQGKSDRDWTARESSLNKTIAETTSTIFRLEGEIATAKRRLAHTISNIKKAERNIVQYTKQRNQNLAMIQQLQIRRRNDHAIFLKNQQSHQTLIIAVEQVVAELSKLKGSVSGVGKPAHVKDIDEEKRDAGWLKKHKGSLLQVFSDADVQNFIQVATEADQDSLNKLIDLLNTLKRSAQKSLADDDESEHTSKRTFKNLMAKLNNDVANLNVALAKQKKNLQSYKRLKNQLSVEIKDKSVLKKKNEEFLAQTVEIRRTEKLKYESDKRQRNREKSIIAKLQKIVSERLANMKDFLKSKVN